MLDDGGRLAASANATGVAFFLFLCMANELRLTA
jgi:hypothetical protein